MFAPEGFLTWREACQKISAIADSNNWEDKAQTLDGFISQLALSYLLTEQKLYLCSPTGALFKAPKELFLQIEIPTDIAEDMTNLEIDILELPNFNGFAPEDVAEYFGKNIEKTLRCIPCFSRYHGTISSSKMKLTKTYLERCFDEEYFLELFGSELRSPELLKLCDQFDSWSVVAKKFTYSQTQASSVQKQRGRPDTGARAAYYKLRPNGKTPADTWESLSSEMAAMGIPISIKSLQGYEKDREKKNAK